MQKDNIILNFNDRCSFLNDSFVFDDTSLIVDNTQLIDNSSSETILVSKDLN